MEDGAGIYRDREGIAAAEGRLAALRGRLERAARDDGSRPVNTELAAWLALENLLDVGETILRSAAERRESRGAHQRTDHPERDDAGWLRHSIAVRGPDGRPRIEHRPVTITRWPPGERVYGR
jgi:fumarate reductase flavoprotein subunit